MRKNYKLVGALAVAGLVAAGGSAFTASNTGMTDAKLGYGTSTVTGITVTTTAYNTSADHSTLTDITFTTPATDNTIAAKMQIKDATTHAYGSDITCNWTIATPGDLTSVELVCPVALAVNTVEGYSLFVS